MVNDGLMDRTFGAAFENGQDAHAVLARVVGQLRTDDLRACRQKISEPDGLIRFRAGFHLRRPADDERDVMAPFEDVGLGAAEDVAGVVALGSQLVELGLR